MTLSTVDYFQEIERRLKIQLDNMCLCNSLNRTIAEKYASGDYCPPEWVERVLWMSKYVSDHRTEKSFDFNELADLYLIHKK